MSNGSDLSSVLDRINIFDRKFAMLPGAIARSNDQDIEEDSLSFSTVRRKRSAHCKKINNSIQPEFPEREKPPSQVHCDGKSLKDTTNQENPKLQVERLIAVAVLALKLIKCKDL